VDDPASWVRRRVDCCRSVWPAAADGLEEEKTLVEGEMGNGLQQL
jgi:hypothetical protein